MKGVELYAPRQPRDRRTWTWAAIVLGGVFIFAGQLLSVLPVLLTPWNLLDGESSWGETAYTLFVAFGLTALIVVAWVRLFERRPLSAIGFNAHGALRFWRGYGVGLLFLAGVVGIIWALGGYSIAGPGAFGSPHVAGALIAIAVLFAGFIVQGSTEEIVMRGWIMQVIASRHGLWIAMIANAVIFGLLHSFNIPPSRELYMGLANIVLFGVFIGLYAAREGSLWGVCGWHAAWNWLLGLGFGLEVSGQVIATPPLLVDLSTNSQTAWWITGGAFGPEASVVTAAVLSLSIMWLALRRQTHDHGVVANAEPLVL